MAANRFRLKKLAADGHRGARLAQSLLSQTDKMLGTILLGNNLVNSASASLATVITFRLVGQNQAALGIATILVTFAILIFSEATPKVIAATHPDRVSVIVSYPLALLLRLFYPVIWLVNLFVNGLIRLLRVRQSSEVMTLTPEELRVLVLESSQFVEKNHQSILLNLFELQNLTVDDVMVPRRQIEMIDFSTPLDEIELQLRTSHHTRLPVCEGSHDNVVGILHTRKVLHLGESLGEVDALRSILRPPYFIPAGTPLFAQLQAFQENHRRIAIVVDEYGEMKGLVTLEDILEQVVGEFTTGAPAHAIHLLRRGEWVVEVDGVASLRELNRLLGVQFPIDGPKTLNGLIVEYFQDIPEVGTCFKLAGCVFEILQTQERSVKRVRLTLSNKKT